MASIDNVNDKQLVAGYLRGKPRSRSMHAATIKEHIKCTGYCRRDPYRQLLVSCCQPRRWTSRTYFYTGCFASNRFSKLTLNLRFFVRLVNILISYIFASYSIKLIFISYFEDSYTVILYREISIVRIVILIFGERQKYLHIFILQFLKVFIKYRYLWSISITNFYRRFIISTNEEEIFKKK